MVDSFNWFPSIFCVSLSFPINGVIQPRRLTINSLFGKDHTIYNRIYFLLWLFPFLKLELICNFLIYCLPSCNVSFQEQYIKYKVNTPLCRQLELVNLLLNCFHYFKGAKILMLQFEILFCFNMFTTQPDRFSRPIYALFNVLIMIKCLQLL